MIGLRINVVQETFQGSVTRVDPAYYAFRSSHPEKVDERSTSSKAALDHAFVPDRARFTSM